MNRRQARPITILMAKDDPDDRTLTQEAWQENRLTNCLCFVADGRPLMDYLHHRGPYAEESFQR